MGSMKLVPAAHLYPLRSLRGKTMGPLVDTQVDLDGGPGPCRVYLSEQETREAAALWGFVAPETLADQTLRAVTAALRVEQLEQELARERASKTVALADVQKLLRQDMRGEVRKLVREYTNKAAEAEVIDPGLPLVKRGQ